jgi:hypothetical protein
MADKVILAPGTTKYFLLNGVPKSRGAYDIEVLDDEQVEIYCVGNKSDVLVRKRPVTEFYESDGITQIPTVAALITYLTSGDFFFRVASSEQVVSTEAELIAADKTKPILVDGEVTITASIEIPAEGITLRGHSFDISKLVCTEDGVALFTSPVGGSGNVLIERVGLESSGAGSKIFDYVGVSGNEAAEFNVVNFNNSDTIGEFGNFRQYLENGTGRFGGKSKIIFAGAMNGARITTSIARGLGLTASDYLFVAGAGLVIASSFENDMNVDLGASGRLCDFSAANFSQANIFQIKSAKVFRDAVVAVDYSTIIPNLSQDALQSDFSDNIGLGNTRRRATATLSAETVTVIALVDTYYRLAGTFTISDLVHFDSIANGEVRCLDNVARLYKISGFLSLASTANDVIDIRVIKDDGSTQEEITHIKTVCNNLAGARDVGFVNISFVAELVALDTLYLEVENKTGANNITAELDSYFQIVEV